MRGRAETRAEEALEEALLDQALDELGRALRLGGGHRIDDPAQRRRRGAAVEQGQRVCEQDPSRRRRRVGQDLTVAVAHAHGRPRDRLIAGEVRATQ